MIGVVGDDDDAVAAAAASIREAGGRTVVGGVDEVLSADPDAVVGISEPAVLDLVRRNASVPVLPVGAGHGLESLPGASADTVGPPLVTGEFSTRSVPLLSVTTATAAVTALTDVMVVTERTGRISEYAVQTVDDSGDWLPVTTVRADGVVVATPAGSHGYSRDAGGPILGPTVDAVSVVPVGPFTVDRSHWVVRPPVRVTVERDDGDVALLADDEAVGVITHESPVVIDDGPSVELIRLPDSQPPFRTRD